MCGGRTCGCFMCVRPREGALTGDVCQVEALQAVEQTDAVMSLKAVCHIAASSRPTDPGE